MEIKRRVLGEFLEEKLKESIDMLGRIDRVGGASSAVRVTNIQRLKHHQLVNTVSETGFSFEFSHTWSKKMTFALLFQEYLL